VKCKSCGRINGVHKMDCDELRLRIHLYWWINHSLIQKIGFYGRYIAQKQSFLIP
jgi:hypothetical protein